jgi:hypothetical protein
LIKCLISHELGQLCPNSTWGLLIRPARLFALFVGFISVFCVQGFFYSLLLRLLIFEDDKGQASGKKSIFVPIRRNLQEGVEHDFATLKMNKERALKVRIDKVTFIYVIQLF